MKIIRDYEKYIDEDTNFRRSSKKSPFKKMKKETIYENDRDDTRKRTDKRK